MFSIVAAWFRAGWEPTCHTASTTFSRARSGFPWRGNSNVRVPVDGGIPTSGRWREAAARVQWRIQPFIGGRYRASRATESCANVNPATESVLCEVAVGHAEDVDQAVRVARQRFDDGCWSELPPSRRAAVLLKLTELIVRHGAQLALLDTLEMGKPVRAALHDAEHFAPLFLRSSAGFADKLVGSSAPLTGGSLVLNTYEPRGVVGLITPWNFPIVNVAIKLGPALAAGNTVVIKPSELTASSALKLA